MNEIQTLMLEHYSKLIQMFKQQFGESCHAVLYSLQKIGYKYRGQVISSSGCLESTQVGDPLPSFLSGHIKSNGVIDKFSFLNMHYPDMQLRSSILFIRDGSAEVFACLCIHHDLGNIVKVIEHLEDSVETFKSVCFDANNMYMLKTFKAADVGEFVQKILNEYFYAYAGDSDITLLDNELKLELVSALQEKGIFEVEGAIEMVADQLDLSKFRIFSYLDDPKKEDVKFRALKTEI